MEAQQISYDKRNRTFVVTVEIARIHAHICADGCYFAYFKKRSPGALLNHKRRNTLHLEHVLEYCNTSPVLLNEFRSDMKKVFNRNKLRIKQNMTYKGAKWIAKILELDKKTSYSWYVPTYILNSTSNIVKNWVRAFFDDEAHVEISKSRIRIKNVNHHGLVQVKDLLKRINVNSKVTGPNCDNSFYLSINGFDVKNYNENIGFLLDNKQKSLRKIVEKMGPQG